jgi:hypothetical protein
MKFDLSARLREASARVGERKDGAWRAHQRWFEIYLTLMDPSAAPGDTATQARSPK